MRVWVITQVDRTTSNIDRDVIDITAVCASQASADIELARQKRACRWPELETFYVEEWEVAE